MLLSLHTIFFGAMKEVFPLKMNKLLHFFNITKPCVERYLYVDDGNFCMLLKPLATLFIDFYGVNLVTDIIFGRFERKIIFGIL